MPHDHLQTLEKTRQEDHFKDIAAAYVHSRQHITATRMYHRYWDQRLHDLIHPRFGRAARYLDPMCGAGLFLDIPLARFDTVYACDISSDMLDHIRPQHKSKLAYCATQDVRSLPFEDNDFDIILIRGGLHHVSNFLPQVFGELYRVLKPGGQLIFSEPVDTGPVVKAIRHLMYTRSGVFEPADERGLTVGEIKRLSETAGFTGLTYEPFTHIAYVLIGNTDFFYPLPWLTNGMLIEMLIHLDDLSRKIPLWNSLCWIGNFSCFKPAKL